MRAVLQEIVLTKVIQKLAASRRVRPCMHAGGAWIDQNLASKIDKRRVTLASSAHDCIASRSLFPFISLYTLSVFSFLAMGITI
jgi:hypothetical protein